MSTGEAYFPRRYSAVSLIRPHPKSRLFITVCASKHMTALSSQIASIILVLDQQTRAADGEPEGQTCRNLPIKQHSYKSNLSDNGPRRTRSPKSCSGTPAQASCLPRYLTLRAMTPASPQQDPTRFRGPRTLHAHVHAVFGAEF